MATEASETRTLTFSPQPEIETPLPTVTRRVVDTPPDDQVMSAWVTIGTFEAGFRVALICTV